VSSTLKQEDQQGVAEQLREWLSGRTFGSLSPVAVELRRDEDSEGGEAWFFDIVLPDPDPAEGTWPVDDMADLEQGLRDEALRRGLEWPWYVSFTPQTDEQQADEDAPESSPPA
jgi:hypothetical protein